MLVLSRRVGETIVIAGDIQVTVVAVRGAQVRLGVTATPSVTVDRLEVHERRGRHVRASEPAPIPVESEAVLRLAPEDSGAGGLESRGPPRGESTVNITAGQRVPFAPRPRGAPRPGGGGR